MNIFFFGDSICFGQFVSPHKTWVSKSSARLSERFPAREISVINTSISGNTTRMALERMPYDVQSHGVHLFVFQFGLNDCNYWASDKGHARVSPAGFEANMCEISDRARLFGAKSIIVNTNHPTTKTETLDHAASSFEENNRRYNEIIRKVAKKNGLTLVDIEKYWLDGIAEGTLVLSELLLPDRIHLSEQGHEVYLSQFFPVFEKSFREIA